MKKYGFQLCQGLKAFAEFDYEEAFRHSIYIIRTVNFFWMLPALPKLAEVGLRAVWAGHRATYTQFMSTSVMKELDVPKLKSTL